MNKIERVKCSNVSYSSSNILFPLKSFWNLYKNLITKYFGTYLKSKYTRKISVSKVNIIVKRNRIKTDGVLWFFSQIKALKQVW